jgi:hypothetical protein
MRQSVENWQRLSEKLQRAGTATPEEIERLKQEAEELAREVDKNRPRQIPAVPSARVP